jgi:hypothetical protein
VETLNQITDWLTHMLDVPLGWLLLLPRDLAILLVALMTSALLTLARKWSTDQDRLRRCKNDLRRLKQLRRAAKREGDSDAVGRIRTTIAMINATRMKAEGKPLLVSIIPIALLAIWALARLDYLAPEPGQELQARAYYPLAAIGKLTRLVPPDGVEMLDDPIRLVSIDPDGEANGLVVWRLRPTTTLEEAELAFRYLDETARHKLTVGLPVYAPPQLAHPGEIQVTEVVLERARFLEIKSLGIPGIPGIPWVFFPPWLVAYLLLTMPLVPLSRNLLRTY